MRLLSSALLAALALAAPALAQRRQPAKQVRRLLQQAETKTVNATVTSIDLETRHVTLPAPDGKTQTFAVGTQARNLPQIKVGDRWSSSTRRRSEIDVTPADPTKPLPQPTEAVAVDRAEPGKKPEGVIARTVTLTGTIVSYDPQKKIAVIKGSGGNTVEVKVQHPERWTNVKVGDTVTAKYSEALAISVQPAAPNDRPRRASQGAAGEVAATVQATEPRGPSGPRGVGSVSVSPGRPGQPRWPRLARRCGRTSTTDAAPSLCITRPR